jgi:hypothetical protein
VLVEQADATFFGTRPTLTEEQATDPDYLQQALIPMSSETHSGEDVIAFAKGPWAHLFGGVIEQNVIFHVMMHAVTAEKPKRAIRYGPWSVPGPVHLPHYPSRKPALGRKETVMNRRQLLLLLPGLAIAGQHRLAAAPSIRLRDLYNEDLSFSDLALGNQGQRTTIAGFMAPPLKAQSSFFVLTKMPMSVCPFCEPGAAWLDDILVVYTKRIVDVLPFNLPIAISGVLELGDDVDPELGYYSKVRLSDANYERARSGPALADRRSDHSRARRSCLT